MGVHGERAMVMLYCAAMNRMDETSLKIAERLNSSGLGTLSILILDAFKPLGVLGAQLIYFLEPFFGSSRKSLNDLGRIIEDPDETDRLLAYLRQEER